jgi:ubiquinone/menaquinone biosynthesis C-methylase UbiE
MVNSSHMSQQFYQHLGAQGLAARTTSAWDEQIITAIEHRLKSNHRILDVGCGYGRITIPLATRGYRIEGIDLSPTLIQHAQAAAKASSVRVKFILGSMCDLPYEENSFDAIICLWSAFHELLTKKEQLQAIRSMQYVLKKGGVAMIEGASYERPSKRAIKERQFYGHQHRIRRDIIEGERNDHYNHDEQSFRQLMKQVHIRIFKIYTGPWAGRKRLFLEFSK